MDVVCLENNRSLNLRVLQDVPTRTHDSLGNPFWSGVDIAKKTIHMEHEPYVQKSHKLEHFLFVVIIAGMVLSGYALWQHTRPGPVFCDLSERISCKKVNQGPWSEIGGVPVALIGFVGYTLLLGLLVFKPRAWHLLLAVGAAIGLGFTVWLVYLEIAIIQAICLLCVGSAMVITSVFFSSLWLIRYPYTHNIHK